MGLRKTFLHFKPGVLLFKVGQHVIASPVLLAPMAGITDAPFRSICQAMGAGLTTSEMLTSDTRLWSSDKSRHRLLPNEHGSNIPNSIQIAGSHPEMMAEAAREAVKLGAEIVDINMGCPAKKVCKKLAGSALLKDEALVENILRAVVNAVDVPVTLKTRTGWNHKNKNGKRVARLAEDCGIQALAIHGRTRECRFNGNAEYDTIGEIVSAVSIPIIANGDIDTPEKAARVLQDTGASAVMIGRGAYGNPWIFSEMCAYLTSGETPEKPSIASVAQTMAMHFKELYSFYGDYKGVRIARKHFSWYCQKHVKDSEARVKTFYTLETSQSQIEAVEALQSRPNIYEEKVA